MDQKLTQLAEHFARMYLHIAQAVRDRFGQEGLDAVSQGLRKFALERGAKIRQTVDALDLPPNMDNYYGNFDNSLAEAGFKMDLQLTGWTAEGDVTHCPFAEIWKEMGEPELGRLYCRVDHDMLEGYNSELKLDRPFNILDGARSCVFHWRRREKTDE
jgi:predicted ArsR family transcriptional regulator